MTIGKLEMARARESRNLWAMEVDEIRRLFKETRKSKKGLAKALGFGDDASVVSKILKGSREIKAREVAIIRSYFNEQPAPVVHEDFTPNVTNLSQASLVKLPVSRVNNVPVYGVTAAGEDGDFSINDGQVIEYVARGAGIMTKASVYALFVQGDSMSPWKEPGQTIYIDPNLPPKAGDYVVIQLKAARDGDMKPAFVKRFVSKTGTKIKLSQHNPKRELEFALDRVDTIHRVLTQEEILGT